MGTRATLTTFDSDRPRALRRLERLLETLERSDAELSTWREESAISRLNDAAEGVPITLSPQLCRLFTDLEGWVRASGRAFDPAIAALTAAWGLHGDPRRPSALELAAAIDVSGWDRLGFDRATCRAVRTARVGIDVGGFGKGEALDRAAHALADDRSPWAIDLGGQVIVSGTPPEDAAWPIGIAHPRERDLSIGEIDLSSGSLATSAGSERDGRAGGRRVGHILDPRTGQPAAYEGSVVVWHASALVADLLSTALYVMGPVEGVRWAAARDLAGCFLVVGPAGDLIATSTPAFLRRFGGLRRVRPDGMDPGAGVSTFLPGADAPDDQECPRWSREYPFPSSEPWIGQ